MVEEPTTTIDVIPTHSGLNSARVDMMISCCRRSACETIATGVDAGRCSAMIARASGS